MASPRLSGSWPLWPALALAQSNDAAYCDQLTALAYKFVGSSGGDGRNYPDLNTLAPSAIAARATTPGNPLSGEATARLAHHTARKVMNSAHDTLRSPPVNRL